MSRLLRLYRSDKGIWRYDIERDDGRVRWSSLNTRSEHIAWQKFERMKTTMAGAAEWYAQRERHNRFMETELGKLYAAYSKATIDVWRHDADKHFSIHRLKELDQVQKKAQKAFVTKLMELANV